MPSVDVGEGPTEGQTSLHHPTLSKIVFIRNRAFLVKLCRWTVRVSYIRVKSDSISRIEQRPTVWKRGWFVLVRVWISVFNTPRTYPKYYTTSCRTSLAPDENELETGQKMRNGRWEEIHEPWTRTGLDNGTNRQQLFRQIGPRVCKW